MKKTIITQILFVVGVIALWEILFRLKVWPTLLFPSIFSIGTSLLTAFTENEFGSMVLQSLRMILTGLVIAIILALLLSSLAVISKTFYAVYNMVVSMFDLIPGIALTPVAILWLGVGESAIIFIVIHSVLWPMSRSIIDGFNAVPRLYLEVGRNIGLKGFRLVSGVFLPAAMPRIFSGIKVGWARAWRGLISAEMIFGTAAKSIGYYIQDRRTNMDVAGVFATLLVIIAIGLLIEYGIFRIIENRTIKKWGMTR